MTTPTSTPGTIALATLRNHADGKTQHITRMMAVHALNDVQELESEHRALTARCEQAEAHAERLAAALGAIVAMLSQPVQYTTNEASLILRGDASFCRETAVSALAAWRERGSK